MDGVNEKGVAIGIMAVDQCDPPYTPGKVTLYTPFLIRMVLDYAADISQAIDLIRQYNVDFSEGTPGHFLIADATGHCAIVEFIDHDIKIVATTEQWQVSTNFNVFGTQAPENVSCWRYNRAYSTLKEKQGNITEKEAMTLLSQVTLGPPNPTMWSMVYNLQTLAVDVAINRNYTQVYHFGLYDFE
jgi:penicillin V acylase-like amidase (Ntn superfamily)